MLDNRKCELRYSPGTERGNTGHSVLRRLRQGMGKLRHFTHHIFRRVRETSEFTATTRSAWSSDLVAQEGRSKNSVGLLVWWHAVVGVTSSFHSLTQPTPQ